MHGELLIPILVPLGFFALIFGIVYMNKKENLAMIDKGMNPKNISRGPEPYKNLKWGLLLVGAGVGLLLAYLLDLQIGRDHHENEAIYFALIAIGGGTGLIISYKMEMREFRDRRATGHGSPLPSEL